MEGRETHEQYAELLAVAAAGAASDRPEPLPRFALTPSNYQREPATPEEWHAVIDRERSGGLCYPPPIFTHQSDGGIEFFEGCVGTLDALEEVVTRLGPCTVAFDLDETLIGGPPHTLRVHEYLRNPGRSAAELYEHFKERKLLKNAHLLTFRTLTEPHSVEFLDKLENVHGARIFFITARNEEDAMITTSELKMLGLWAKENRDKSMRPLMVVGTRSKGDALCQRLYLDMDAADSNLAPWDPVGLLRGKKTWEHVIFVDNRPSNVRDVREAIGASTLYSYVKTVTLIHYIGAVSPLCTDDDALLDTARTVAHLHASSSKTRHSTFAALHTSMQDTDASYSLL
jgi:hypothetical protein